MPIYTKNAMKAALKKIIKKKPLSKITISDIAEECGISRMTFYYHFKDIYDLVEWCVISDAQAVAEGNVSLDTWENELVTIFKMALLNKEFYLPLFNSMDKDLSERYILRYTDRVAERIVDEALENIETSENNRKRLASYYSHAIAGIISCWAMEGMEETPEYISACLKSLITGGMNESIKTAAEMHKKSE
jgi:probable dihydroxyacetone kinase regulator